MSHATNRRVLSDAGETIERFFTGGLMELKDKLGPVNWQFMATKKFDADDFEGFLNLLPKHVEGRTVRHVLEVRHDSFRTADFVDMARAYGVAVVLAADTDYPQIADITAPFVYVRLMGTRETEENGYPEDALDLWAERARLWSEGAIPEGLRTVTPQQPDGVPRDVFVYVISGHKLHNPAAAMALIERLG